MTFERKGTGLMYCRDVVVPRMKPKIFADRIDDFHVTRLGQARRFLTLFSLKGAVLRSTHNFGL
jgi:hypothetical protein